MSNDNENLYDDLHMEEYFERRIKERERDRRRRMLLVIPIRVILFPIMLFVRLFRWTYYYD